MNCYVLDGHTPVPEQSLERWGAWMADADRVVRQTHLKFHNISTVFLGIDHNHFGDGPPILFETMVFTNEAYPAQGFEGEFPDSLDCYRYSTWDEAEAGHEKIVRTWIARETTSADAMLSKVLSKLKG